ncbi:hypothetical protein MY8738_004864 [Beauveria namnaoensis]
MAPMAPMVYMAPSPEIHTKTFVGDPVIVALKTEEGMVEDNFDLA